MFETVLRVESGAGGDDLADEALLAGQLLGRHPAGDVAMERAELDAADVCAPRFRRIEGLARMPARGERHGEAGPGAGAVVEPRARVGIDRQFGRDAIDRGDGALELPARLVETRQLAKHLA